MFQFDSVLCQTHSSGQIQSHSQLVYSVIGNRIKCYDTTLKIASVLDFECANDIRSIHISPCGRFIFVVDTQSIGVLITVFGQVIQHAALNLKQIVSFCFGSTDFLAIGLPDQILMYKTNLSQISSQDAFVFHQVFQIQTQRPVALYFSPDDSLLCVQQENSSFRVFPVSHLTSPHVTKYKQMQLMKQMFKPDSFDLIVPDKIIKAFFLQNTGINPYTYTQQLCNHELEESDPIIQKINEQFENKQMSTYDILLVNCKGQVTQFSAGSLESSSCYSFMKTNEFSASISAEQQSDITVINADQKYNQIVFATQCGHYIMHDVNGEFIHSVSVSAYPLTSIRILSPIQVACASTFEKSLAVFNHQSESFELQEQSFVSTCFSLSHDGLYAAVGSVQGTVFVFNTITNMLTHTYIPHTSQVKSVQFFTSSKAIASCAADSVVCYDMNKQLMFRHLTTERNLFVHVAVEQSGEILAAADADFQVHLFDIQSGKLIDSLRYHEGPVTQLQFNPDGSGQLFSSSWDQTVRVLEAFKPGKEIHVIQEESVVLGFVLSKQLIVYLNDGSVNFYENGADEKLVDYINVKRHMQSGRLKQVMDSDKFETADSQNGLLIGGGKGRYVVVYNQNEFKLKIQLSINYDLDGIDTDQFNQRTSKKEFMKDLEQQTKNIDLKTRKVLDPILALENKKTEARTLQINIAKDGTKFFVLTTFGLLTFKLKSSSGMNINLLVTHATVNKLIKTDYQTAMLQACQLQSLDLFKIAAQRLTGNEIFECGSLLPTFIQYLSESFSNNTVNVFKSLMKKSAKELFTKHRTWEQEKLLTAVKQFQKILRNQSEIVELGTEIEKLFAGMELEAIGRTTEAVEDEIIEEKIAMRRR
ncbi:WD40_repeat protein [Hexamita inflata]|uniref:WD40 repeat protein n=1 Tax=Hexamita inflata TaxID=28002 RepID=A0AA86QTG7_9EUKA|nr:WD40 repeat protein [Hexamita inflata]